MSIGVGEGIELSATACTLLNNKKLGVSTYITTLKFTSKMHFLRELVWIATYACIVYAKQANFTIKPRFKNLNLLICHFRVSPGLCIKTRLSAQIIFILMSTWPHFESEGSWNSGVVYCFEKNSHAQRKQMQKKLFTNDAWWWNLLVWRKHA